MPTTLRKLFCCLIGFFTLQITQASPASTPQAEEHFDTLTIGTQTYSNVTVTTRNKDYVFFLHSRGMMNIKVTDLPLEARQLLGYEPRKTASSTASAWTKEALVKLDQPEVKEFRKQLQTAAPSFNLQQLRSMFSVWLIAAVVGGLVLIHLFFCYCSMLICKKVGQDPGILVWLPILQMIPLFRAAGMSPLWLLACLLPILNIVAQVMWCIKIVKARGKGAWTTIFLILPFTNLFAFLYLAFSDEVEDKDDKRIEIMSLETA